MSSKKKKVKRRPKKLDVAHVCRVTPGGSGLYETTRELVAAERKLGINAHIVDPRPSEKEVQEQIAKLKEQGKKPPRQMECRAPHWIEDRGVCNAPVEWGIKSDFVVSHSGINLERWEKCKAPMVHVPHGRPRSSFLIEHGGDTAIYSVYRKMEESGRFAGYVCLWPEFTRHWQVIWPKDKVITMNAFVDLDFWKPEGPKGYGFHGAKGEINVVIADRWRLDKEPFHQINAFSVFAEKYPQARLHIYGCDNNMRGIEPILEALKERGVLGEVTGIVKGLWNVIRACDLVITPHSMAVRTVREALACGTQVIANAGNRYTPYVAFEEDLEATAAQLERAWLDKQADPEGRIKANREVAEREFDVNNAAQKFVELFAELRKAA